VSTATTSTRLERLRERTNGYTVTPEQYVRFAYVALGALTLIVMTGAAVRLSGSGLGCPTWPKCYGNIYPPLRTHAVIEFSNRLITVPVCIAAGMAWLAAVRRRPYRRDLVWLGALLPLGVIAQAVLGGLTVRGKLDYGWVMGHFALSMLILLAALVLVWRARHEPLEDASMGDRRQGQALAQSQTQPQARGRSTGVLTGTARRRRALFVPLRTDDGQDGARTDPGIVKGARWLVALGALTIFAGTAATAAGPHAGGEPGQKINRLSFDGRGTMDFVIHRHAEIAFVFSLAAVALWWLARRRPATPMVRRSLTVLCVLLALQGAVGLDQYETHLPTELVWVHVTLACACWLSVLWVACAAGRLAPRPIRERPAPEGEERHVAPPARVSA
jgi:heme a synthase